MHGQQTKGKFPTYSYCQLCHRDTENSKIHEEHIEIKLKVKATVTVNPTEAALLTGADVSAASRCVQTDGENRPLYKSVRNPLISLLQVLVSAT